MKEYVGIHVYIKTEKPQEQDWDSILAANLI